MMNYKWLYKRIVSVLFKPSAAWDEIAGSDKESEALEAYFYPMLGLSGMLAFIVFFITDYAAASKHPFDLFKDAIIGTCTTCMPMFVSFFATTYLINKIAKPLFDIDTKQDDVNKLVAYSMTVLFVTYTFLAFPIDFKILLWLCQVYTIYLVWEGCGHLFKMDDNKRLVLTVITFLSMLMVAGLTYFIFYKFI